MDYLEALNAAAARRIAGEPAPQEPICKSLPAPPVTEQVRQLFTAYPGLASVPLSLDSIRGRILGRFGRPPQRGELAVALKLLGFKCKRLHGSAYGSRRFWIAPDEIAPDSGRPGVADLDL